MPSHDTPCHGVAHKFAVLADVQDEVTLLQSVIIDANAIKEVASSATVVVVSSAHQNKRKTITLETVHIIT